jgi:hypothetical protein
MSDGKQELEAQARRIYSAVRNLCGEDIEERAVGIIELYLKQTLRAAAQPPSNPAQPTSPPWPLQENKLSGWTIDFKFLQKVQEHMQKNFPDESTFDLESIEAALLSYEQVACVAAPEGSTATLVLLEEYLQQLRADWAISDDMDHTYGHVASQTQAIIDDIYDILKPPAQAAASTRQAHEFKVDGWKICTCGEIGNGDHGSVSLFSQWQAHVAASTGQVAEEK